MEPLTILLILISLLLLIVGVAGAVLPVLPGPPFSYIALVIIYFGIPGSISGSFMIFMLVLTIIATILDYIAPAWMTRLGGGSKQATWGSILGTLVGLFFSPWGLIFGPLVGAFIGELMHDSDDIGQAVKVAILSFIAFLLTTGLKLILTLWMAIEAISALIQYCLR